MIKAARIFSRDILAFFSLPTGKILVKRHIFAKKILVKHIFHVTYAHKTLKIWRIWYSREKLYSQSIEVKSSGYKTHGSLDAFCQKFSDRIVNPYLVYTKDLQKDGQTLLIPIYMTPFL